MMSQIQLIPQSPGMLLMIGALVAWYIASRACVEALAPRVDDSVPRRAVAYWLPIALLALLATSLDKADLAIGTVFGTSVASLSLVLGLTSLGARAEAPPLQNVRGPWSMVAPLAIILLLAGFAGYFDWFRAAALLLYGLVALYVWIEQPQQRQISSVQHTRLDLLRVAQLVLAICLAAVGAMGALEAAEVMGQAVQFFTGTFVGAALIAPALVLPIIGNGTELAHHGQQQRAVSSLVIMVLLNLCLLLPVVIVLALFRARGPQSAPDDVYAITAPASFYDSLRKVEPLAYPLATWRVDTIFLIILGFMLIPLAAGRWAIGRGEALGLVFAYAVYLAMLAQHAIR